jgi:hypothetical protein
MPLHSLGLLKLAEKDTDAYYAALANYGYATSASFLRACALALIKQDKAGDRLVSPLSFQTGAFRISGRQRK